MRPPATRTPAAARGQAASTTLLIVALLGLGAAGVWVGIDGGGDGADVDPARIVTVERGEVLDAVTASGRVEPVARVAVMSRAGGILEKLLVEEGDAVTRGQILAELDREQLERQLDQDRADLASAQARLAAARARLAEARVRLDDPALPFAEREVERLSRLRESGDVAESVYDEAVLVLEEARFRVAQARASLSVLEATIQEAEADLSATRAALERSQTALAEATIRSPIDGVVLERLKEVGDGVSSILTAGGNATQIMMLGDLSEQFVEARVDEVDLGRVHVGQPARVTVDAYRDRVLPGRVARIAPSGTVDDNGIVTFEVRVTVDEDQDLLRPDMTAEAKLVLEAREGVPTLPQRALRRGAGGWFVERLAGGDPPRRERVRVEIGTSDGLITEIREGLQVGDRVLLPEDTATWSG